MKPEYIIIHCSDSKFGNALMIDRWHREKGWRKIGYQYVITNKHPFSSDEAIPWTNAQIEAGRREDEIGAHCLGYNGNSIGICLIGEGEDTFTTMQIYSAIELVKRLMVKYDIPKRNVLGHYETEKSHGKTCPNLDMNQFRKHL